MSTAKQRIGWLAEQAEALAPWTGAFGAEDLRAWLELELGDAEALDRWVEKGSIRARAVALSPVLHVVSGNTPHAAFQSVLRGLLAGCRNRVKLPAAGLPEFERWIASLPEPLGELVETRRELPEAWLDAEAAVVFGGAETIRTFRELLPAGARRIEHGPKLSVAMVFEAEARAAKRVAEDILRHDQRGCLSVQAVFVEGTEAEVLAFGGMLAEALQAYRAAHGRPRPSLSDSGAVSNLREVARFREANGVGVKLWESRGSTDWTLLYEPEPVLAAGPLNGFVRLHRLPERLLPETFGGEWEHVSTVAIHPFTEGNAGRLEALSPPRICAAGSAQDPTLFWHHDGLSPLAGLVRWRDLG